MHGLNKHLIHITVGYNELPDSPIRVNDTHELVNFLRREVGDMRDKKGNEMTDDDIVYALDTCGIGSIYDMPSGAYSAKREIDSRPSRIDFVPILPVRYRIRYRFRQFDFSDCLIDIIGNRQRLNLNPLVIAP